MERGHSRNLTQEDKDLIIRAYSKKGKRKKIQKELSKKLDISTRSVRYWAKKLGVGVLPKNITDPAKVMIYDIETSRVPAWVWWSGKQFINGSQLIEEPKIITVAWKWLGSDKVHHLTWDKDHEDKALMKEFIKEYNKADLVIGYNNDNFDNRWINARAIKHGLTPNTYVRSLDLMKECKRLLRLPSYSLAYVCNYFDVTLKQGHEGLVMWEKIQQGSPKEQKEYLKKMIDYNVGDIVSTEEVYVKLRPHMAHKTHFGVLKGEEKWSCPNCGGLNVKFHKRTITPAGTVQIIMQCKDDDTTYKITNKQYMNFLDYKMKNG